MNYNEEELIKSLQEIGRQPVTLLVGKVLEVDTDKAICKVESQNKTFFDVALRAINDGENSGLLVVPEVNSIVLIGRQFESKNFSVVMTSTVSEIHLKGDDFNGLVKVSDLVTKLNDIENDINDLKTVFSTWVTVPNDGGAALKAAAGTWYASLLTPTDQSEIENENVKHGSI